MTGSTVRPFVAILAVVAASVASGALECSHVKRTAAEERGAELYGRMCAVCHGANGQGYKADEAPAIAHAAFLSSVGDDYLRSAIAYGRAGTTMSAWSVERGGPLSRTDVDAVIAFLRTWQHEPRATLDERPLAGDPARGNALYVRECQKCHGVDGTGGPFVHVGNPQLLLGATNGQLRRAIEHGRVATRMPAFGDKLGRTGVDDVIAWLRGRATSAPRVWQPPARPPPIPLGPVPLHARGPEPEGFSTFPATTRADVVKAQLDRGAKMALLDARAPSDYANEHIAGAVSVPFYDPDHYFAELPKDAWLVCYCACPHAESSTLAQKLVSAGFKKVTVLDEGLGVWRAKKYGTKTGLEP